MSLEAEYERFHGCAPGEERTVRGWAPGRMVRVGRVVDVGYGIAEEQSEKVGFRYVHHCGEGVGLLRRPRAGERGVKVPSVPGRLWALGVFMGGTVERAGGKRVELAGRAGEYLCWSARMRSLVVVGRGGVRYVIRGGDLRVTDWVRG